MTLETQAVHAIYRLLLKQKVSVQHKAVQNILDHLYYYGAREYRIEWEYPIERKYPWTSKKYT